MKAIDIKKTIRKIINDDFIEALCKNVFKKAVEDRQSHLDVLNEIDKMLEDYFKKKAVTLESRPKTFLKVDPYQENLNARDLTGDVPLSVYREGTPDQSIIGCKDMEG